MKAIRLRFLLLLLAGFIILSGCTTPEAETVEITRIVTREVEVQTEVTRLVTQEVEVPMEVTRIVEVEVAPEAGELEAQPARELFVRTGAGRDTVAILAFFPESLRVRAGDTVTWQIDSDEPHTATFLSGGPPPPDPIPVPDGGPTDLMQNPVAFFSSRLPDAPVETYSGEGYFNSGFLSNGVVVPPNEAYSLTFDTPGRYNYVCLLHPEMKGEIIVESNTATEVPSQEEIDAQAEAEAAPLLEQAEIVRTTAAEMVRSVPGVGDSSIWYIPAGVAGADPRVQIYDFLPKNVTIAPGDTVIWTSTFFHQVIFAPGQAAPEFIIPEPQDQGPPRLLVNPIVAFPIIPSGAFDGVSLYSSGLIGTAGGGLPGGTTFTLTFTDPGSYSYVCATHRPLGMEGTITVAEP